MVSKIKKPKKKFQSFQDTILNLQKFWSKKGCIVLQPYDMEVGAGTFHPATTLRSLGSKHWKAAYVQPSRRPTDGRYGDNPNRLQHYYQFQVLIKPSPDNIKKLYLNSLSVIGIYDNELYVFCSSMIIDAISLFILFILILVAILICKSIGSCLISFYMNWQYFSINSF